MPARDDVYYDVFCHVDYSGAGAAGPDLACYLRPAVDLGFLDSGLASLWSGFLCHCYHAGRAPYASESAGDPGSCHTRMKTEEKEQHNTLAEVVTLFLRLGFTAFGGPAAHIAMMRREVVERRKWVSDERFLDLLSIINLIPGPTSTELAIYLGYLRAGWPGLVIGGICFIGPAMLIVLALAWAYATYGSLPQVAWLFYGIKPVVIAIIAQALWGLCRTILKGPWPIILALMVFVLYLLGINVLVLL